MRVSIKAKISIATLAVSLLCSGMIGLFSFCIFRNNLEDYMGKRALDIASTVSANISGDDISRYDRTEIKDDKYDKMLEYMRAVKEKTSVTYLYVIAEAGTDYKYIAEGAFEGENASLLGDRENKENYGIVPGEVFASGKGKYTEVYTNGEWGNLISGFAPVFDSNGNITGVVGLDIGADIINASMDEYTRILALIVISSGIILFLAIYFIFSKMVVTPIKVLGKNSLKLTAGKFDIDIPARYIAKNDEIGDLANSFVSMSTNMKNIAADISYVLTEMADRNLTTGIVNEYVGDYRPIKDSINHIIESYNNLLVQFAGVASELSSGSQMVADISQTLSAGTAEQAASTEELSVSINDFGENLRKNSENTSLIQSYTFESGKSIAKCNDEMQHMLVAMDEIKSSSDEISDIIKIIDDISFQTNILALNASVEAARVGEAGKGFAVVAREVRNLASKTAEAARKTSELIEESINAIERGRNLSSSTAKALETVTEKEKQVGEKVNNIAEVSIEQTRALEQIILGLCRISEVVQKNSDISHECAAASQELSGQAAVLNGEIDKFRLKWPEK